MLNGEKRGGNIIVLVFLSIKALKILVVHSTTPLKNKIKISFKIFFIN